MEDLARFAVECLFVFVCTVIRNGGCKMPLDVINYTRVFGDAIVQLILVTTFPMIVSIGFCLQHELSAQG